MQVSKRNLKSEVTEMQGRVQALDQQLQSIYASLAATEQALKQILEVVSVTRQAQVPAVGSVPNSNDVPSEVREGQ